MRSYEVAFVVVLFGSAFGVADRLDDVFLKANLTLDESEESLANAREGYAILNDLRDDGESILANLAAFTARMIEDLDRDGLTACHVFENARSYLKGNVTGQVDADDLGGAVRRLLDAANGKLRAQRPGPDATEVLSRNDTTVASLFGSDVDASSLGFFFLEVFATLVGLSWGIISTILAGHA